MGTHCDGLPNAAERRADGEDCKPPGMHPAMTGAHGAGDAQAADCPSGVEAESLAWN